MCFKPILTTYSIHNCYYDCINCCMVFVVFWVESHNNIVGFDFYVSSISILLSIKFSIKTELWPFSLYNVKKISFKIMVLDSNYVNNCFTIPKQCSSEGRAGEAEFYETFLQIFNGMLRHSLEGEGFFLCSTIELSALFVLLTWNYCLLALPRYEGCNKGSKHKII